MTAITGATGHLGRLVIADLLTRVPSDEIVALARTPSKGADLGVTVRTFDYDRPETLPPALEGVDRLLLISASEVGKRVPQHQAVIDAAKAAGVSLIVYTSVLHAPDSLLGLADEHRQTEAALARAGFSRSDRTQMIAALGGQRDATPSPSERDADGIEAGLRSLISTLKN